METFIHSHWILPYPNERSFWPCNGEKKLQMWASTHTELLDYYQVSGQNLNTAINCSRMNELPLTGWEPGEPMPLDVELPTIPTDLENWLGTADGGQESPGASPTVVAMPLHSTGVVASDISCHIENKTAQGCVLHSFTLEKSKSGKSFHKTEEWLINHLHKYLEAQIREEEKICNQLYWEVPVRSWACQVPVFGGEGCEAESWQAKQQRHRDQLTHLKVELRGVWRARKMYRTVKRKCGQTDWEAKANTERHMETKRDFRAEILRHEEEMKKNLKVLMKASRRVAG